MIRSHYSRRVLEVVKTRFASEDVRTVPSVGISVGLVGKYSGGPAVSGRFRFSTSYRNQPSDSSDPSRNLSN